MKSKKKHSICLAVLFPARLSERYLLYPILNLLRSARNCEHFVRHCGLDPQSPKTILLFFLTLLLSLNTVASNNFHKEPTGDTINKPLLLGLAIGTGVLYAGSIYGLYNLWYKDYPQSSFHFFNDNREWMQADKLGHATSAYYISMAGFEGMRATGCNNKSSALIGGSLGLLYLTTVETFDGFSAQWGASGGDLIANTTGTVLFIGQQLSWKEQRIKLKWSYHPTKFAQYRPDLLGSNHLQRALKDYNGHSYWLSVNLASFLRDDSRFPGWLNIAAGYRANGMTGAFTNPLTHEGVDIPYFERHRHYLISPDIDLSKIKTQSTTLNIIFKALSFIKLPMPAVEFSKKGVKAYGVYY